NDPFAPGGCHDAASRRNPAEERLLTALPAPMRPFAARRAHRSPRSPANGSNRPNRDIGRASSGRPLPDPAAYLSTLRVPAQESAVLYYQRVGRFSSNTISKLDSCGTRAVILPSSSGASGRGLRSTATLLSRRCCRSLMGTLAAKILMGERQ